MAHSSEERLGELLRLLRPAPDGWVRAAQELPFARRTFDEIVARAEADAELRAALVSDLEAALEREGIEPRPALVEELRQLLVDNGRGAHGQ
jgi:hypothetical protein